MALFLLLIAVVVGIQAHPQQGYDIPQPQQSYGAPSPSGQGSSQGSQNGYGGGGPSPSNSYGGPDLQGAASTQNGVQQDPIAALGSNIPGGGVPGEDYPILSSVPDTGFTCEDQEFPGYFADTADEAGCQVFHICQFDGRLDSFLCPNGTIFNQQYFVCDWWFNVDCAASDQFFGLNAEVGQGSGDNLSGAASNVSPSTSYGAPDSQAQAPSQLYGSPSRG